MRCGANTRAHRARCHLTTPTAAHAANTRTLASERQYSPCQKQRQQHSERTAATQRARAGRCRAERTGAVVGGVVVQQPCLAAARGQNHLVQRQLWVRLQLAPHQGVGVPANTKRERVRSRAFGKDHPAHQHVRGQEGARVHDELAHLLECATELRNLLGPDVRRVERGPCAGKRAQALQLTRDPRESGARSSTHIAPSTAWSPMGNRMWGSRRRSPEGRTRAPQISSQATRLVRNAEAPWNSPVSPPASPCRGSSPRKRSSLDPRTSSGWPLAGGPAWESTQKRA